MGKFDTGGKHTIHTYVRAWAEWLLERQKIEVEAELSGEFQIIARATDVLLQVKGDDEDRFLSLTELQTRPDANMPRRLTAYAALAREKYRLEVYVTVLYLLPPPPDVVLAEHFHSELMGQTAHQDFKVIKLWELDANEALALNNPALLPFVPLMRGGATEEALRICVARIRQEPEAEELEIVLAAFAGLVMDIDVVKQMTRWSMHIIKDSPLYKEFTMDIEQARAEARAEGREEGRDAALLILRRFLAYRFGISEDYFDDRLQLLDLAGIKHLNDAVVDAGVLAAFETILSKIVQSVQQHSIAVDSQEQSDNDSLSFRGASGSSF